MKRFPLALIVMVAVVVLLLGGAAVAATMGGDSDELISGTEADRAAAAALDRVDGQLVGVEVGDDDGAAYEVELRTTEGEVEVLVDKDFTVISVESEGGADDDSDDGSETDEGTNE